VLEFNATLLIQIFHFVLLLILLRLVAYKPVVNLLEERRRHIADNIAAAEKEREEAEKIRARYEEEMRQAREKAEEIIQRAGKAGEEQARQIVAEAKKEAASIKEDALAEIQREKEKALAELRDEVASLSVLVAEKIINEEIDIAKQRDMVDKFIKEAGELPC